MVRAAPISDGMLDVITRAILARVQPRRIVLIGSRARGDAEHGSDYDVVIEVDSRADERSVHSAAVEALSAIDAWIDVIVCSSADIERWQDDPGMLHWDISREGVLLYPRGAAGYQRLEPRPVVVREGVPESVEGWLERAAEDLQVIDLVVAAGQTTETPWGAASFHAQQAAEKYLKALLVKRWIKPPHHHDLHKVVQTCRDAGFDLPDLFAESDLLNKYAVDVHYPLNTPIPHPEEGRRVVAAGLCVVDIAKKLLG